MLAWGPHHRDGLRLIPAPGLKGRAARSVGQALHQLGHGGRVQAEHALPGQPGCPLGQPVALQQRAPSFSCAAGLHRSPSLWCHPGRQQKDLSKATWEGKGRALFNSTLSKCDPNHKALGKPMALQQLMTQRLRLALDCLA